MSAPEAVQAYLPLSGKDRAVHAPRFPADGYAWGIDTGKRRVALAAGRPPLTVYVNEAHRGGAGEPEATSLIELERLAHGLATATIDKGYPPCLAVVEFPFGRNRVTEMGASYGAVTLGVARALADCGFSTELLMVVGAPKWKRDVVGRGNASKAQVREWAETWVGGDLGSEDAADAVAICRWAMERFS